MSSTSIDDFITGLFIRVDTVMAAVPTYTDAHLYPGEQVLSRWRCSSHLEGMVCAVATTGCTTTTAAGSLVCLFSL